MKPSLGILWPKRVAPEILEVQFSHDFCGRVSRELCTDAFPGCSWLDYPVDRNLEEILLDAQGDMLLVVTDPEIVLSPSGVKCLIQALENGHVACGPVYNLTAYPSQQAHLTTPYVNVSTYLEIARGLSEREDNRYIAVDALDPACVIYRRDFLRMLGAEHSLSEIPQSVAGAIMGKAVVDTGALVHCFGDYYEGERDDLVRLVPESVKRVLDIGCAKGGYGKRLKNVRPDIFLMGVELNPTMAESASRYYDEVVRRPVEEADLPHDFDLVNCGDILEHLQDPWQMLNRLYGLLRPAGYLVLSIPNMGHWSLVRDLLQGRFQYIPVGLTCITHIRWFTESSIRQALEMAGFAIDIIDREKYPVTPQGEAFIHDVCVAGHGDEESLMTNEFVIRAIKK